MFPAKPLFQAEHALTGDGKTKVPRLDDAGVDRADGDFMHTIAFDTHEGVVLVVCLELRVRCVVAQRIVVGRPVGVAQPRALIGLTADIVCADGHGAEHVHHRPLHAVSRRKDRHKVGEERFGGVHRQGETN